MHLVMGGDLNQNGALGTILIAFLNKQDFYRH
jgi:hypothetical protein